jgi:hypothetical protein
MARKHMPKINNLKATLAIGVTTAMMLAMVFVVPVLSSRPAIAASYVGATSPLIMRQLVAQR